MLKFSYINPQPRLVHGITKIKTEPKRDVKKVFHFLQGKKAAFT